MDLSQSIGKGITTKLIDRVTLGSIIAEHRARAHYCHWNVALPPASVDR